MGELLDPDPYGDRCGSRIRITTNAVPHYSLLLKLLNQNYFETFPALKIIYYCCADMLFFRNFACNLFEAFHLKVDNHSFIASMHLITFYLLLISRQAT